MEVTQSEEKKKTLISGAVTLTIAMAMLLILLGVKLVSASSLPTESKTDDQNLSIAMLGSPENNSISESQKTNNAPLIQQSSSAQKVVMNEGGEKVLMDDANNERNEITKNYQKNKGVNTTINSTNNQETENTAAQNIISEHLTDRIGTKSSGFPSSGKNGLNITGTNYGFDLQDRMVLQSPLLPKDIKDEGTVVVDITVNKEGTVIEAEPNGRGTNTNSAILKAQAKQTALNTKFNKSSTQELQKGTITITFLFK